MECLSVEYVSLNGKLKELFGLYMKLSEEIENIAQITEEMDIFWDGGANTAYVSRIGEDLVTMEGVMIRIRKTLKTVQSAHAIYLQAERAVQSMIGRIRTGR